MELSRLRYSATSSKLRPKMKSNVAWVQNSLQSRWGTAVVLSILILVAFYRTFSLDIMTLVTNDGVYYLSETVGFEHWTKPWKIFIPQGSKTSATPMIFGVVNLLSRFLPIDALTLISLAQRVALFSSVLWLVFRFRLMSLPLMLFLTSPMVVAHHNAILAEGFAIPSGIALGLALTGLWDEIQNHNIRTSRFVVLLVIFGATFLFNVLAKTPYIVLAVPALIVAIKFAFRREYPLSISTRELCASAKMRLKPFGGILRASIGRLAWACEFSGTRGFRYIIPFIGLAIFYIVVVACNYYYRYDRFTLAASPQYSYYYQAYLRAVYYRPENRSKPEMQDLLDGGIWSNYSNSLFRANGYYNYQVNEPLLLQRADSLIERGNVPLLREQIQSIVSGFLFAGELSDIQGLISEQFEHFPLHLACSGDCSDKAKFNSMYNLGRSVGGIKGFGPPVNLQPVECSVLKATAGWLFGRYSQLQGSCDRFDERPFQLLLMVSGLGLMVWLGLCGRLSAMSLGIAGILSLLLLSAALGYKLADIWRYIIPVWVTTGILMLDAIVRAMRQHSET